MTFKGVVGKVQWGFMRLQWHHLAIVSRIAKGRATEPTPSLPRTERVPHTVRPLFLPLFVAQGGRLAVV